MPDATSNGAGWKGDPFPELSELIDHAQLFIGVDSAPAHIAAAVNTPLISLFGATDHYFWRRRPK
ncbi:glycosyltransferase family 9 protein [Escherichia coli]